MEKLLSMCDPSAVQNWQANQTQLSIYAQLLDTVLNGYDEIKSFEKHQILREGEVHRYLPESSLNYLRGKVEPRIDDLKAAYRIVDPGGAELYELLEGLLAPSGARRKVLRTFEVALDQVYELIDRNPDQDFGLLPDAMSEVLDAKLFGFAPDTWLDRAADLEPIRTGTRNASLPVHIRLRMEELSRAYIFGCWLSVLALSRAVLEYAVIDNCDRFHVQLEAAGKGRKNLDTLINEVGVHAPELLPLMDKLRRYGNHYLHPKPLKEEPLFRREKNAKDALQTLVKVVEGLYLVPSSRG